MPERYVGNMQECGRQGLESSIPDLEYDLFCANKLQQTRTQRSVQMFAGHRSQNTGPGGPSSDPCGSGLSSVKVLLLSS